jgi:hypothetical protein
VDTIDVTYTLEWESDERTETRDITEIARDDGVDSLIETIASMVELDGTDRAIRIDIRRKET